MALGRVHEVVNLLALPAFLYFIPKEHYLTFVAGYLIGTFLLSPDLDLKVSKPTKRWGPFRYLWRPYQKKSRHRGLSHVPFFGTFLRLSYITAVLLFISWLLGFREPFRILSEASLWEGSFYFLIGIVLSEIMHIIMDVLR